MHPPCRLWTKTKRYIISNSALVHRLHSYLYLPPKAEIDVYHLALACHWRIDYLLTWNLKHLANGQVRFKLARYQKATGISDYLHSRRTFKLKGFVMIDNIVEEIHAIRDKLYEECGGDSEKLAAYYLKLQEEFKKNAEDSNHRIAFDQSANAFGVIRQVSDWAAHG